MALLLAEVWVTWEMTRLHRVTLGEGAELVDLPGPRWVQVCSGSIRVDAPQVREYVDAGDAILLDALTPHQITARTESALAAADLRASRPGAVPSPLLVRNFSGRHPGVSSLLDRCPQQVPEFGTAEFTESYGNLIAAAMMASWREEHRIADEAGPADLVVEAVIAAISAKPGDSWTVTQMAEVAHLSRSALSERFRRRVGRGPAEVLRDVRMERARRLLRGTDQPVESIATRVGYGSAAAFGRAFVRAHELPPERWRRNRASQAPTGARPLPKPAPAITETTAPIARTTVMP